MSSQTRRKAKRLELSAAQRIDVNVQRYGSESTDSAAEPVVAKIVDISLTGLKLEAKTAFEFQEKIVIEIPRLGTDESINVAAQVRWVQPSSDGKSWAAGCLIAESFPADYIDEIAQKGILERRVSPRTAIEKEAVGRWELSQEDFSVSLKDVSANGIGIVIPSECKIGKRLRIEVGKGTDEHLSLTAKAVWHKPVAEGFFVGCEIAEGSASPLIGMAITSNQNSGHQKRSYQTLTFSALSLLLALVIRQIFF